MDLESTSARVELDGHTGGFRSILDKRTGTEYIHHPELALLFRVMAPRDDRICRHLDAAGVTVEALGTGATVRMESEELVATVVLTLEDDAVTTQLTLTNRGSGPFEEVFFPYLRGLGPLEQGAVTLPNFGRRCIEDPLGKGWGGDHRHAEGYLHKMTARYPERMVCAWCVYGSPTHGLSLEARHRDFSIVDFYLRKAIDKKRRPWDRSLEMACVHPRRIRPGETWQSPPMRLFVHPGDWHAAADAHRAWLETWVERREPSRTFAQSIGWHYFFMKHQDGAAPFTYRDLPRMAAAAMSAGCPYMVLFGWHAPGHDNAYPYRYFANEDWGGQEALKQALDEVHALGVEAVPFYNGTLANTGVPEHAEVGHAWVAHTREGHPYYAGDWTGFTVDAPSGNRSRIHHELCFTEPMRESFLADVRRLALDYGFGNIQLDQIAIKMYPCYREDHGHAHPDRACVDGIAALLPEVRRIVQQANPEGILLSECTNAFTGQWCDAAWTWDFLAGPEPVLYSVPWLLTSTAIDAEEYGDANKAFAYKIGMDLRIAGGDEMVSDYPEFAAHLRGLAALRRRVADYHAFARFRDREGVEGISAEGVTVTAFAGEGRRAIVLAETRGQAAEVALGALPPHRQAVLHSNADAHPIALTSATSSIPLAPYEVKVLCMDL